MSTEKLGLGARLVMAFVLPWQLLFDGELAARLRQAVTGEPPRLPEPVKIEPPVIETELPVVEAEVASGPDYTSASAKLETSSSRKSMSRPSRWSSAKICIAEV